MCIISYTLAQFILFIRSNDSSEDELPIVSVRGGVFTRDQSTAGTSVDPLIVEDTGNSNYVSSPTYDSYTARCNR